MRNKDNLWFLGQYLNNGSQYMLFSEMFNIVDPIKYDLLQSRIVSKATTATLPKSAKSKLPYMLLDKHSNMAYTKMGRQYGFYEVKAVMPGHVLYDKTKVIKEIHIYDTLKTKKFVIYPQIMCYEPILDVFDEYELITNLENKYYIMNIEKELANIIDQIYASKSDECKNIQERIENVLSKLDDAAIELNKNTYNILCNYLDQCDHRK